MLETEIFHTPNNAKAIDETEDEIDLKVAIRNVAKAEGYENYKFTIKAISTNGGNYLGDLYNVTITDKTTKNQDKKDLFVKKKNNLNSCIIRIESCYENETFFYAELFKLYEEIQNQADIPKEDRFNKVKFYPCGNEHFIFMDNMIKKGYTAPDRSTVSLDCAKKALTQLAKFHALSFALETQKPDYYNIKIKSMRPLQSYGKVFNKNVKKYIECVVNWVEREELRDRLRELTHQCIDDLEATITSSPGKVCCIIHNDFRGNNLLIRENEGVLDMTVVDYQLAFYGHPLVDFFYFLLTTADDDCIKNQENTLKLTYYNELRRYLKYFDIDVESKYPREKFDKDFEEMRLKVGLVFIMSTVPLIWAPAEDFPDVSENDFLTTDPVKHPQVVDRVNCVINHFVELGLM